MTIKCLHGYFMFDETKIGQISDYLSFYGLPLVKKDTYYTFETLKDAPRYSIKGGFYLGAICTKTFEGEPWEVMRENGLVYNFILDKVVPIASVTQRPNINQAANYFFSDGLLLPGSVRNDGKRVKDYTAGYSFASIKYKYSEVVYG